MTDRNDRISPRQSSPRDNHQRALDEREPHRTRVKPATGEELQARRREAAERFLQIAEALKAEAGVTRHDVCKELSGLAYCDIGVILAPEGRTRKQLYIVAHECAHVLLHKQALAGHKPRHIWEFEAEQWAHDALRRHGVPVPRTMTSSARSYVGSWIAKDEREGQIAVHEEALRFSGQLTRRRRAAQLAMAAARSTQRRRGRDWFVHLMSQVFGAAKALTRSRFRILRAETPDKFKPNR